MQIEALLNTASVLVVNKPSGIHTEGDSKPDAPTPCALVRKQFGFDAEEGLLHRLDFETSGCVAFARTSKIKEELRNTWSHGEVKKKYLALTETRPSPRPPFDVDFPIGHSKKTQKKMIAVLESRTFSKRAVRGTPKNALTQVLSIESIGMTDAETDTGPLFEWSIQIITGRRHQIRVHLSALGCPVLGDSLYEENLRHVSIYIHPNFGSQTLDRR